MDYGFGKEPHEPSRLEGHTTQSEAIRAIFACDFLCLLHGLWVGLLLAVNKESHEHTEHTEARNTIRGDHGHFCV